MATEIKVPQVGESISEVTIGQWLKSDGTYVEMDDVICEVESEKATIEVVAPDAGVLKVKVSEGETVPIGAVIAELEAGVKPAAGEKAESKPEPALQKEAPAATVEKPVPAAGPVPVADASRAKVTPVAEKVLREAGVAAAEVSGSGAGGRVTKSDALAAVKTRTEKAAPTAPAKPAAAVQKPAPAPQRRIVGKREERRVNMSTLRQTIARRLVASKNETAMLTTFNEVDMGPVMDTRARYKEAFQKKFDVKLGMMSFFVRAVCVALEEFPEINASVDGDQIVYHDYCDISIAVSTPQGLVVPVIFNAEQLNLAEIEMEVARLAQKARDKKLSIEEMTGGTFSITNGGVFGSLLSTPIINPPQSAILGMHKIQERPMALEGQVVIRPMMYVSLSYDHRLVDGKESVSFLVRVKELLEDPVRMLLEI